MDRFPWTRPPRTTQVAPHVGLLWPCLRAYMLAVCGPLQLGIDIGFQDIRVNLPKSEGVLFHLLL